MEYLFYCSDIAIPAKEGNFFVSDDLIEFNVAEYRDGCFYTFYAATIEPKYWRYIEMPEQARLIG